ncbi:MAG: PLP-dependent transferase [Gemmatimonadetes bacterium]|nr:PLP-dependent transferase [Gemmatimonadota bacterium]
MKRNSRLRTRAVHAGREDFHEMGVHAPPIDLSSTYPVQDLERAGRSIQQLAEGRAPLEGEPIYARLHNPTVARYETALAELEGAEAAVGFASGMAAISACLMAAAQDGPEIVAIRPLYGGTDHILADGIFGLQVKWVEADRVADAITGRTSLVVLETPANPTLDLVDIADVVRQAGRVPVLVDNTFATPVLQKPLDHGARIVVHSGTKFLGGHGDVVAGLVATDEAWCRRLRKIRVGTGGILHPLAAYLLHRGLPTLPLRVEEQQRTTVELVRRLAQSGLVENLRHPSLPGADPRGLIGTQMAGPGSLFAFDVPGGFKAASQAMANLHCMNQAVSLGSVDTLVQHPAALTHRSVDPRAREQCGVGDATLRVSVGLEDVEDLWEDLEQALTSAHPAEMV